jgi:putative PIN family toxin of toxin-antitoxin system
MSAAGQPLRAVIDTNLFVSGLISRYGQPQRLIVEFRRDAFSLVISEQLRSELEEVLQRRKLRLRYGLTAEETAAFLLLADAKAAKVDPSGSLPIVIRDPKDAIVLAAALEGNVDYLVTGDNDLLVLDGDPSLAVLAHAQ